MKTNAKNLRFWERYAGIYDRFIKKDKKAYEEMYRLIRARLHSGMKVLELATGTGLISLKVADQVKSIEATDFSPQMIAEAKKKKVPGNVNFAVQDACNLPYKKESFDAVIISNALHIMPDPELALKNIRRVLKKEGILIAPTFTHAGNDTRGRFKARIMELFGFKTYYKWTTKQFCDFLGNNGFLLEQVQVLKASFPITYVQAYKKPEEE